MQGGKSGQLITTKIVAAAAMSPVMPLPPLAEVELSTDLEAPGVLAAAARRLSTQHGELVFMATGPDDTSMLMAKNALVTIACVGSHANVVTRTLTACARCMQIGWAAGAHAAAGRFLANVQAHGGRNARFVLLEQPHSTPSPRRQLYE